jgi:hypothetical protein
MGRNGALTSPAAAAAAPTARPSMMSPTTVTLVRGGVRFVRSARPERRGAGVLPFPVGVPCGRVGLAWLCEGVAVGVAAAPELGEDDSADGSAEVHAVRSAPAAVTQHQVRSRMPSTVRQRATAETE